MKTLIVTHMGSPETLKDIPEFLQRIFLDKDLIKLPFQNFLGPLIAKLREPKTKMHYIKTGGASPLAKITDSIARKLKDRLVDENLNIYVRFTHSKPYLENDTNSELIVFPLYPQYSKALTGAIEKKLPQAKVLKNWHVEEEFIECMKKRIKDAVKQYKPDETVLLFIAHSLPASLIEHGDPYKDQVEEMFQLLSGYFKEYEARLAYIGKVGPKKWIGPEAQKEIKNIKKKNVICTYLSLPVDNIEILYDIDFYLRKNAKSVGIENFIRVQMPND
ncbi:unnamed protein product, partial [marine sediment metagenome]